MSRERSWGISDHSKEENLSIDPEGEDGEEEKEEEEEEEEDVEDGGKNGEPTRAFMTQSRKDFLWTIMIREVNFN